MVSIEGILDKDLRASFFDMAYSPFVILNKELNFVDMNKAAETTIMVKRKDFIGRNLLDFFPYLENSNRLQMYKDVIETGNPMGFDELAFHTNKGVLKFMLKAFKIGDYLGLSTLDVTVLTKNIDKLKVTKANLQVVNDNLKRKNQELEEFSYVAAHDLRAPLTNIHSLLDMLQHENAISDEGKPIFDKVQIVAKLMCDKLQALNKVIALKSDLDVNKEEVDFAEIVKKIQTNHSQEIIKSRAIIKVDFASCPTIQYNAVQMESILQNLISNAIKYKHQRRKPVILLKTKEVKGKKTLIIKDNGLGFDMNIEPNKIFGLFKRMHVHVEGLGVGLYIVHSIITNNGGKINVQSEVNKGTEFKINF